MILLFRQIFDNVCEWSIVEERNKPVERRYKNSPLLPVHGINTPFSNVTLLQPMCVRIALPYRSCIDSGSAKASFDCTRDHDGEV